MLKSKFVFEFEDVLGSWGLASSFLIGVKTADKKTQNIWGLIIFAIHILVKKGELLIWRQNGHFPHCGAGICMGKKISF
jgi:hypothetical protein